MKVKELMERVGMLETGRAIAYIKDGLDEMNMLAETHVTTERIDINEVTKRGADEGWENSRFIVFVYNPDNRLSQIQNWTLFETKSNREFMRDSVPSIIGYTHLSIRSIDNDHLAHDWRDLMRIKNELIGPDREAIELYPSMERIHDTANQFHLWVLPEGMLQPVGWLEPDIIHKHQIEGSTNPAVKHANQRTFEKGFLGEFDKPSDLNSPKFDLLTVERRRAALEEE